MSNVDYNFSNSPKQELPTMKSVIEKLMNEYAEEDNYEDAARMRDLLNKVKKYDETITVIEILPHDPRP